MKIQYHPEVSKEVEEAFEWYESQKSGLGLKFINETEMTIHRISNFPDLHPEVLKKLRRAILPIFPYGVIYSIENGTIVVYAIAHLHRMPFYWRKRISKK
jgi:hypothetical protein